VSISRFLVIFLLIAAASGIAAYFLEHANPSDVILVPQFWMLFSFLIIITVVAYLCSIIGLKKGSESSIYVIMGVATVKLLLCMTLVLIYSLNFRVNAVLFAIEFFSLYFLFTSFEVYALMCNLRHQNKT
jgi:hypothetical protein